MQEKLMDDHVLPIISYNSRNIENPLDVKYRVEDLVRKRTDKVTFNKKELDKVYRKRCAVVSTNNVLKQMGLGNAYCTFAEVRETEENLTRAIRAYKEALKIYTVKKYPVNYAMTQNNLCEAYCSLAVVREKKENLTRAIRAYKEALKIFTVEKYPLFYKLVMSNIRKIKREVKK